MSPIPKRIIAIVMAILIAAGVGALVLLTWPPRPAVPPKEEIVIGMSISLTGKYATPGTFQLQGVQLWVEDVKKDGGIFVKEYGRKLPVRLIYYDDKSEKETAVKLAEKLIVEENVDILFGPYGSPLTFSVAPIAEKNKKLMISIMGSSDEIFQQGYKYIVQLLTPGSLYLRGVLDLVKQKDPYAKKVAALYADDPFSTAAGRGAVAYAKKLGFEVVFDEIYPKDITDFSSILIKLKGTSPDVIVGGGHYEDGILLVRQMKEMGVNAKAIGLLVAVPIPKFREDLGAYAEYILGPSQWEPGVKYRPDFGPTPSEFYTRFKDRFGKEPEYRAASGYAAGLLAQKLIEEAGTLDSEKLREKAGEIEFTTFWGKFKIDPETGLQLGHDMVVMMWIEGKKYIVWPPEAAEREPVYPRPAWGEIG